MLEKEGGLEMEEFNFFIVMREFIYWTSPVVLLLGVILLVHGNYKNFEMLLSKRIDNFPKVFTNS